MANWTDFDLVNDFFVGAPITFELLRALAENPIAIAEGAPGAPGIDGAAIIPGTLPASAIAAGSVDRAALKTAAGEVSTVFPFDIFVLPGGEWGFYPQVRGDEGFGQVFVGMGYGTVRVDIDTSSLEPFHQAGNSLIFGTNLATVVLGADKPLSSSGTRIVARQRYVQSSPPYDLGDGEIALFVFAQVENGSGRVRSAYVAPDPPWANNGPTEITPHLRTRDGRAWRFKPGRREAARKAMAEALRAVMRRATSEEIERHEHSVREHLVPVDQALKNADMGVVPHPFCTPGEDCTIVMLDPPATHELQARADEGENLIDLINRGDLALHNDPLTRSTPPGVTAVGFAMR